jgi:predicted short-subunit dehydrogenase-like oxidoreductase (DUF2520 family)
MTVLTVRTPNVFIVGAGPVAGALAGALRHSGAPVLGLWARRPEAARKAAAASGVAAFSAAPPDLLLEADAIVLAVRDDAIAQVARMLCDTGLVGKKHVLLHCSGALAASEVLGGVAGRVAGVATLHPLRSIVDARAAGVSMKGTVFGVEGDEAGRPMALELARLLGGRPLDLRGETMALYHAAASMASNALVALASASADVLSAAGVPPAEALAAIAPLMLGTVENLIKVGLPAALTGPIARGDSGTVERHLAALRTGAPQLLELYAVAARKTLAVARQKGDGDAAGWQKIETLLGAATAR